MKRGAHSRTVRCNVQPCRLRQQEEEALLTHANRRMKAGLTALAAIAVLAFGAGAALGTVIESGFYSGTDSYSFDDCGFTLNVESEFSGHFVLRADKDGQAFYGKDNFSHRDVLTNADTGQWFVVRGNGLFSEIKATQVSGNIYEFVAIEAGQPFVIGIPRAMSSCGTAASSAPRLSSTRSATGSPGRSSSKRHSCPCADRTPASRTTSPSAKSLQS